MCDTLGSSPRVQNTPNHLPLAIDVSEEAVPVQAAMIATIMSASTATNDGQVERRDKE